MLKPLLPSAPADLVAPFLEVEAALGADESGQLRRVIALAEALSASLDVGARRGVKVLVGHGEPRLERP